MEPDFIERAFEEFKQQSVGSERTHEGMGLGLTITKRLIELMGGDIAIESRRSAGTRVSVTLPLESQSQHPGDHGSDVQGSTDNLRDRGQDGAGNPGKDKPLVLAVEDNSDMLALMRLQLNRRCEVVGAESGKTALRLAGEQKFDLVLMDINLGEESGVDVLRELRTMDGYASVPVIAVTAYALPGDRDRLLQSGFDGYVGKPFTKKQLFGAMDRVLVD